MREKIGVDNPGFDVKSRKNVVNSQKFGVKEIKYVNQENLKKYVLQRLKGQIIFNG